MGLQRVREGGYELVQKWKNKTKKKPGMVIFNYSDWFILTWTLVGEQGSYLHSNSKMKSLFINLIATYQSVALHQVPTTTTKQTQTCIELLLIDWLFCVNKQLYIVPNEVAGDRAN